VTVVVRVVAWPQPSRGLRALDPARDLGQIADLVEHTFADEPDDAGRRAVTELRRLNQQRTLLWVLSRTSQEFGDAFSGFVWVENGRIVGNTSITREDPLGLRWLLSSVAVEPGYRRRGIARAMVNAAVEHAREHGAHWVELLVKVGNSGAVTLYEQTGFVSLESVTTLRAPSVPTVSQHSCDPALAPIQKRHADRLLELARESTPPMVQRVRPIRADRFAGEWRRGLLEALVRARPPRREWWGAWEGGRLVAAAGVGREKKGLSTLELMVAPDARCRHEAALLEMALSRLTDRPNTPVVATLSGRDPSAIAGLLRLGFQETRTLTRMIIELAPHSVRGEGGRLGGT
jgi:ribosomal protein S18 acetylase RimI-like enzyme